MLQRAGGSGVLGFLRQARRAGGVRTSYCRGTLGVALLFHEGVVAVVEPVECLFPLGSESSVIDFGSFNIHCAFQRCVALRCVASIRP